MAPNGPAVGGQESQLTGTADGHGAVIGTELGVDPAQMRVYGVDRDGQFAGDLGPGQLGRQISQHPELARTEFGGQRREVPDRGDRSAAQDIEDVGEQCGVSCLMR